MNRPFVSIVLAYAVGLLLAQCVHLPLTGLFIITFSILAPMLVFKNLRARLLWPLLLFAGWTNFESRTATLSPYDLRTQFGNETAIVFLRGELAETPRLKLTVIDDVEKWRSIARVRVSEISSGGNFQPATGEMLVTTPGILGTNYFTGQPVLIGGTLSRPDPPLAEGLFDYRDYLEKRGIAYQLKVESTNQWQLLEPITPVPPLTDRFLNWSQNTLALGLPEDDETVRLLWAMTLGWRTAFTGDVGDPFLRAGTMHMFAIDGLRIALLSGMIVTLLRVLRLSRAWCGAIAVPIIWFYTAATGWEPSAFRASVMMTIVLGGWSLKRPGDLMNSLAAAALIILVWEPRQLFEASFQLSFFVMLVIGLMLPPLNLWFDRILHLDPLLPVELASRWKKLGVNASRWVLRYAGLSFAAWMGSIPLSAKYFHLFSPVSTLANIFAVPLGTFALMANLGALICGHWLPWLTEIFNNAAWGSMHAMTWVSEEATKIPGAYFYVPEPSLITIAIYYGVLIAAFSGWFKTSRRITGGVMVLVLIAGGYLWQWQSSRGETDLTVLPLNGGHAIYVDAAGRSNDWLINDGNELIAKSTVKDFLRAQGVNHIPRLMLTEGSVRDCGGTRALNQLFGVDEVWTSGARFRSPAYREAVAIFDGTAGRHKFLSCGETAGCWQALFPEATNTLSRASESPLVLMGYFDGAKVLLLSDLNRSSQSDLLSRTNDLRADIVVAGLPDEGEPLCDALIAAVRPKVMVIADSEFPATRRASDALKARLEKTRIPVIYTRDSRAVKICVDQRGWMLKAMDGQRFEGRQD